MHWFQDVDPVVPVNPVVAGKGRIELSVGDGWWMADFSASADREDILTLVGTTLIQTPFGSRVAAHKVLAGVQSMNPRDIVVLR